MKNLEVIQILIFISTPYSYEDEEMRRLVQPKFTEGYVNQWYMNIKNEKGYSNSSKITMDIRCEHSLEDIHCS